jgi:hypothetical protein
MEYYEALFYYDLYKQEKENSSNAQGGRMDVAGLL